MDINEFPEVPAEMRPKVLYHTLALGEAELSLLRSKGWTPTDVRLLPANTDSERSTRVKAYLEGLMYGTIELTNSKMFDILELEAKSCGDIGNKTSQGDANMGLKPTEAHELLKIGSKRAFAGSPDEQAQVDKLSKGNRGSKT
jgi:hypothetical protein